MELLTPAAQLAMPRADLGCTAHSLCEDLTPCTTGNAEDTKHFNLQTLQTVFLLAQQGFPAVPLTPCTRRELNFRRNKGMPMPGNAAQGKRAAQVLQGCIYSFPWLKNFITQTLRNSIQGRDGVLPSRVVSAVGCLLLSQPRFPDWL